MTPVGYLLDGHTPKWWVTAVRRADPSVRIARLGSAGTPPLATPDPELLTYCEANKLVLVSCDRRSLYGHVAAHTAAGRAFYGLVLVEGPITTEEVVDDLRLIYEAHTAEDLIDAVLTIPL